MKPFGDFRFRHESDVEREGQEARHRERIRLRFGASYDLGEDLTVAAGLRTGNQDSPRSPHQTLGDRFHNFSVNFDQVYVRWHPKAASGFSATAGKFPQPFVVNPVFGEMQWDADLRPEGVVVAYQGKLGSGSKVTLAFARYILLERGGGDDSGVWAGQAAFELAAGEGVDWSIGLDFHEVTRTSPGGSTAVVADNAGNLLADRDGDGVAESYASAFRLLHPQLALKLSRLGLGQPVTFTADLVKNRGAVNRDDTAYSFGAAVGAARKKGDWMAYWQYLKVEQESLFSLFAQDDFPRSTNFRGHILGFRYLFHDKGNVNLWVLPSRNDTPAESKYEWRLRADLNISL